MIRVKGQRVKALRKYLSEHAKTDLSDANLLGALPTIGALRLEPLHLPSPKHHALQRFSKQRHRYQMRCKLKRASQENRLERQLQQLTYAQGADPRRDRLPAAVAGGCQLAVPSGGAALREGLGDPDEQQELRGLGRHLQRCGSPLATAILDRLLHHSTTINIKGETRSTGSRPGARRGCSVSR